MKGHGLVALVALAPPAMFVDFGLGARPNAVGTVTTDMCATASTVAMHGVKFFVEGMTRSPVEGLKCGVTAQALEPKEREKMLLAKIAAGPLGPIAMLENVVIDVGDPTKSGLESLEV
jgi:hypothetical protein